jgi:hypothetical protein
MRAYRSRSGKAVRILDTDLERQARNGTDAWNRHQAPAHRIRLDHLQQHTMHPIVALKDGAAHIQHGLNGHCEGWIAALDQLTHAAS